MIILGIDPGTATTGYGIVEKTGNNIKFVTCGANPRRFSKSQRPRHKNSGLEYAGFPKCHEFQSVRSRASTRPS